MSENKKVVNIQNATVPFYEYYDGDTRVIEFDSSQCIPPEPMVNAMSALELIKDAKTKVVMINHKSPVGLFPKIEDNFDYEESKLKDGRVRLVFSHKENSNKKADLSNKKCNG
jgi:hypothetical protein